MTRKLMTAAALALFVAAAPMGFAGSAYAKGHGGGSHHSAAGHSSGGHSHGGKSSDVAKSGGKHSGGSNGGGDNGFDTAHTILGMLGGMMARQ